MRITVNGVSHEVGEGTITYEQLVRLMGFHGTPDVTYYVKGEGDWHREGTLGPGRSTAIAEGMRFTMAHTGNA